MLLKQKQSVCALPQVQSLSSEGLVTKPQSKTNMAAAVTMAPSEGQSQVSIPAVDETRKGNVKEHRKCIRISKRKLSNVTERDNYWRICF